MAATVVGTGGFVAMVGTIADGSVADIRVDLAALAPAPDRQSAIDLRGGATPPSQATSTPTTPAPTPSPTTTAVDTTTDAGDTSTTTTGTSGSTVDDTPVTTTDMGPSDDDTDSSGS